MRVLGPAIIDNCQQRDIEKGRPVLVIGRDRVFPDAAARARVGDLWWVKETYTDVLSAAFGCPKHIHEMVPGSALGMTIPQRLKPIWHLLRKKPNREAFGLRRGESRATLRINEITPSSFVCEVLMMNVDEVRCEAA